jgi:FMN-dependent NADH-azoreductase
MAPHNPAMSELIPLSEASRAQALDDAVTKAKTLAERLAA